MNSIVKIIETRGNCEAIMSDFFSICKRNKFPDYLVRQSGYNYILFARSLFYVQYEYNQFLDMQNKFGFDEYYVLPTDLANMCNDDWDEYEKQHLHKRETKINYFPLLNIKGQPNFEDIQKKYINEYHILLTEFFVFTPKLDWIVQHIAHRNTSILHYNQDLEIDTLDLLEDKINSYEEALVNCNDWGDGFNQKEKDALKAFWFSSGNGEDLK